MCKAPAFGTVDNSVTNIGYGIFEYCDALSTIYSLNPIPPNVNREGLELTDGQYQTITLYVPQESLEKYKSAEVWKNFRNIQGIDASGIEDVKADGSMKDVYYDI